MSSAIAVLVPSLCSFGTLLCQREDFRSSVRKKQLFDENSSRSRSVMSSPSRNDCALFPNNDPPVPAWPKAAKCCAWSITSRRRPLNAFGLEWVTGLSPESVFDFTLVNISDISFACSSLRLKEIHSSNRIAS